MPFQQRNTPVHHEDEQNQLEKKVSSAGERVEEQAEQLAEDVRKEVTVARRPWYQVVRWGRTLLGIYAVLLVLFGLLAWWVHQNPVLSIDVTITRSLQEDQNPWLNFLMIAVSYQGYHLWLDIGLIALAAVLFWVVDLRLEAIVVVLLSCVSAILNTTIKALVDRARPSARLVDIIQGAGGPSFPSGHVMSYIAFWGLLFFFSILLFDGRRWWRIALACFSALMVLLVGPSRIYLGDHWASDVLGAYLIGGALLGITLWLYLFLKDRGVLAPRKRWSWYRRPSWRS